MKINRNALISIPIIVGSATIVTALACLAAARINHIYYRINPFFGDTSSFFYVQFTLYFDSLEKAKDAVIWDRFLIDPKNPLAYLHYLAFPQSFLLSMNSHLVFTGMAFAAFSALLGWTVFARTGSLIYGAVAPFLIFCAEGLFDPMYQLPSKLSDPPAAFIFGAAVLCVVNSKQGRSLAWLAAFGLFAGLTLLSRFTSSGYLFFVCAPVLALYFVLRWREQGFGQVARAVLTIAIPLAAVAGWHFIAHIRDVLFFYGVAGYSLNQGLVASVQTTLAKFAVNFAGGLGLAVPVLICGAYIILFRRPRLARVDLAVSIWVAIAVPLVVIGILRIEDDAPQLAFGLAGYLIFALAPLPHVEPSPEERRRMMQFALVVALALLPATLHGLLRRPYVQYLSTPGARETQMVEANRKMAEHATLRRRELQRDPVIDAGFDYYWRHLQPTAYYSFGTLLRTTRQFEIRQEKWWLRYRNKSTDEIMKFLASDYTARTDILYLFADPTTVLARALEKDDYTVEMAKKVRDWVRTAPGWSKLGDVDFPYGVVEIWANDNRR